MDPHFHAMKDRDSSDVNNRDKNMRIGIKLTNSDGFRIGVELSPGTVC